MTKKSEKSLLDEMLEDESKKKLSTEEESLLNLAKEAFHSRWRKIKKGYKKLYSEVKEEGKGEKKKKKTPKKAPK